MSSVYRPKPRRLGTLSAAASADLTTSSSSMGRTAEEPAVADDISMWAATASQAGAKTKDDGIRLVP